MTDGDPFYQGGGYFRRLGLVKVLWKSLSGVVNRQIGDAKIFHGILHGLQLGQGVGTASLETNLLQNLTAMGGGTIR